VVNRVLTLGGAVISHDHYAHGRSGPHQADSIHRCQIYSFPKAARDVNLRVKSIKERFPGIDIFLHGHSMGGTIACLAALEGQENLSGLILESAAIELHPKTASWTVRTAAKILSKISPSIKIGSAGYSDISRKPEVCERLKELSPIFGDNGGMTAKTAVLFIAAQDSLRKDLAKIRIPSLVTSGSDDYVTSVKGSEFAAGEIKKSKLKIYDGAYHLLHDELDETTNQFLDDIEDFVTKTDHF